MFVFLQLLIDLYQSCPIFLVLRATFRWGNLARAANVFTILESQTSCNVRNNLQIAYCSLLPIENSVFAAVQFGVYLLFVLEVCSGLRYLLNSAFIRVIQIELQNRIIIKVYASIIYSALTENLILFL